MSILNLIKRSALKEIVFIIFCLIIFLINATYVSYPDEFVNLLGGKYINQGLIPYHDFFDHHMPLAWYLSAFFLKLSLNSFIVFRLYWAVFSFILLTILAIWIRRNHKSLYLYYLGFMIMYPLVSVYLWLHLFLADSLAVLFFSLIFWILLVESLADRSKFQVLLVTSFLTFCLIFSSLSFLYVGLVFYLWQLYLFKFDIKKILTFCILSSIPYLIYLFYLFLTRSLYDFYFANFVYNTKLYIDIPNYTRGRLFNPLKFALTLIYNFWSNFLPLLATLKDFNLYLPLPTLAALGTLSLLTILSIKNVIIGGFFFLLLSFSAPRSNIKVVNETDYQIGLFILLGITSAFIGLYLLKKIDIKDTLFNDLKRIVQIFISILLFFTFIFLLKNTYDKWYLRYTQKMPSIQNSAPIAQFVDDILDNNDYYWLGPYEPHEEFFVKNAKLPGKYISLLPQFKENEYLKKTFIEQFEKHPPSLIVFKKDTGIYLTPAYQFGDFFLSWMKDKYTVLDELKGITMQKSPTNLKLMTHVYLLNSKKDILLNKLKEKGYIE